MNFSDVQSSQYLTFEIASETYAVSILRVHGILEHMPVTPVPGSSPFIRGVFNHGGIVTPVIDLAARLGLGQTRLTRRTCFILVGATHEDEELPIGLMVDAVTDVVDVARADIQSPPDFGSHVRLDYLEGLTRTDDGFTVLLSVDRFLTANELLEIRAHAQGEQAGPN